MIRISIKEPWSTHDRELFCHLSSHLTSPVSTRLVVTFLCQDSPGAFKLEGTCFVSSGQPNQCSSECGCAPCRVSEKVGMDRDCWIFVRGQWYLLIPILMTDGLEGINDDMILQFVLSCFCHSLHQANINRIWGYLHMIHVYVYYMCMPCSFTTEILWHPVGALAKAYKDIGGFQSVTRCYKEVDMQLVGSTWNTWQARFFLLLGILLHHGWLCHKHPWLWHPLHPR